jgi:hypothetical protein
MLGIRNGAEPDRSQGELSEIGHLEKPRSDRKICAGTLKKARPWTVSSGRTALSVVGI